MKMKLLSQNPSKVDPDRLPYSAFLELLAKDYELVKRADTEVVVKGVDTAIAGTEYLGMRFLNDGEILKSILKAAREGLDGVIVGCYFDPALRPARQLLDIPVVGLAESAMHMACSMASRFATITTDERYVPEMTEIIHVYGMSSHAISRRPVRAISLPHKDLYGCFGRDYSPAVESFREAAVEAISDGAEVLISGCGLLSVMLTQNGLTEVDGVPVIDPFLSAVKQVESLVDLRRAGIPIVSRRGLYLEGPGEEIRKGVYSKLL